jgi:uncharacterized protein (TIGR03067 family)
VGSFPHNLFRGRSALKRHTLLAVAVALLVAADDAKDDPKKELKKFEGTWQFTSIEIDGQKPPEDEVKKHKVIIEGEKYTLKIDDNVVNQGTIKVDPTKKPKTIDITTMEGGNPAQVMLGIYEEKGDEHKVCYAMPGQNRPEKFSADAGTGNTLVTYKKEKR